MKKLKKKIEEFEQNQFPLTTKGIFRIGYDKIR